MRTNVPASPLVAFAVLGTAAAFALGPTPAAAQARADSILYACYVPQTGTMYRIKLPDTKDACTSDRHVQFSWNAVGRPGIPGVAGPVGPQGPQGVPGAAGAPGGVSGYEIVTADFGPMLLREFEGTVSCPAGKRVLGGGASAVSSTPPAKFPPTLSSSTMLPDGSGWSGKGLFVSDIPWLLHVSAICANVAP